MRVAVIGSGPTGTACAEALIRRGIVPTVIDVGERLPADSQAAVDRMAAVGPTDWAREDREFVSQNPSVSGRGMPMRFAFGSDFHFARDRAFSPTGGEAGTPAATFARGGYSVAWGGAVLPADGNDLGAWPIDIAELEPSYRRVLAKMPLSAASDELESAFPLYKDNPAPLPQAEEWTSLLNDLRGVGRSTGEAPFLSGQARLAVDAEKCRRCGLCLSGCVYGAIYSTSGAIEKLERAGAIKYLHDRAVQKVAESDAGVTVRMHAIGTGGIEEARFDKVFLAAGAIQSTRIVLASLGLFDRPVLMKDSQKFVLPLLRARRFPLAWPDTLTLAQVFAEFKVPSVSERWVHAQFYAVNNYILERMGISPWVVGRRRRVFAPVYERLLIALVGLHSDHSSAIELKLSPEGRAGFPVLRLRPVPDPRVRKHAGKVARHFSKTLRPAGVMALPFGLTLAPPGGGNHFGCTMPMSADPRSQLDTDLLGRPAGWRRIHVVDGAVLPSIPATTITLLQMANADRITTAAELN